MTRSASDIGFGDLALDKLDHIAASSDASLDDSTLFAIDKYRTVATPEELMADLRAFGQVVGNQPVTASAYNRWPQRRFSKDTIVRGLGTWEVACSKAGLTPKRKAKYSDIELIEHFEKVWRWRGRRLVRNDLHEYNRTHKTTVHPDLYVRRWGSFPGFVRLFSQFKMNQISLAALLESKVSETRRELISPKLRALVLNRDQYTCVDCGASPRKDPQIRLHIHHKLPVSMGGRTVAQNLVTNCQHCNLGKGNAILSHDAEI